MTRLAAGLLAAAAVLVPSTVLAQARSQVTRPYATRAELESLMAHVPRSQEDLPETRLLRHRLEVGDFEVGDRIVLSVAQDSALNDTVTVTPQRTILLTNVPAITVAGVLRSELQDHLTTELSRYIREPRVRATPLVRISVLGEVVRPGFYHVPAETVVGEVIMRAGGPTSDTDIERTTVVRGSNTILSQAQVQLALANGTTLDRLNLIGGDELRVGRMPEGGNALRILGAISGAAFAIVGITQIF